MTHFWKKLATVSIFFICGVFFGTATSFAGSNHVKPKKFTKSMAPKFARHLYYQPLHLKLIVKFDFKTTTVSGWAEHTITPRGKKLQEVDFDAAEMTIKQVLVGEKKCKHRHQGQKLYVTLPTAVAPGKKVVVRIQYWAKPRQGLYFVLPTKQFPDKPVSVYSQGETENHRFWFPSYDYTNARFTSETVFTAPSKYQVIANGKLVEKKTEGEWTTWHHKMNKNHVNYLLSVVIGQFHLYKQEWKGIPILSYVPLKDKHLSKNSFANTADMMDFFSRVTGVKYPYSKYAQSVVYDFTSGGMENITATTLTHKTLHDDRAHLDFESDGLVAHELAHQWYGDLLTCKDWSHIWLNESFATYFAQLYYEHKWGKDEFNYRRMRSLGWYMWEARARYKRAIDSRLYKYSNDVFDSHAYPKGAAVLHMIRRILGDKTWWKAIQYYTRKYSHKLVVTADLRRAFERVSHLNWEPFFAQWVSRPGHPELNVKTKYNKDNKTIQVTVRQSQKGKAYFFDLPIRVVDGKTVKVYTGKVTKKYHSFVFPFATRPEFVEVDPARDLLAVIRMKQSVQAWRKQAAHGSALRSRIWALKELGKVSYEPASLTLLDQVLSSSSLHYSLGRQAADSLGKLATKNACKLIRKHINHSNSRIRSVLTSSLVKCDDKVDFATFKKLLEDDLSYNVQIAAIAGIEKLRQPDSYKILVQAAKEKNLNHGRVQAAAISALVKFDGLKVIPVFKAIIETTKHEKVIGRGLNSIAQVLRNLKPKKRAWRKELIKWMAKYLKARNPRIIGSAIYAFKWSGASEAIPYLQPLTRSAPLKRHRERVSKAIKAIVKYNQHKGSFKKVNAALKALKKAQKKMMKKIRFIEKKHERLKSKN